MTADPASGADLTLVAEATRRSEALWLAAPGGRSRVVWHIWHDGAAYVVGCHGGSGGAEQPLPELADRAEITVRSRARPTDPAVGWIADVSAIEPGSAAWDDVTGLLAAARLNAIDATGLPARWAADPTIHILRLSPLA